MTLVPDRGRPIFPLQENVDITQGGTKPKATYDLALYEELGSGGTRAVLVVTIILVFDFTYESSPWTEQEKLDFMADVSNEVATAWGEQYEIRTTNPTPAAKVAGVKFDIQTKDGGATGFKFGHGHWNVTCRKVSAPYPSGTTPGGGGCCSNGKARWDSRDLTLETPYGAKTSLKQRGAVHEFGHMLGYRDEYPGPKDDPLFSTAHLSDEESVMYWGEKIRPRHYVFLADWISLKWIAKDSKNCKGHDWKVDGKTDLLNAGLS
jgi:hypothetical protein